MAVRLNALFDKKRVALTRARLRAWWEGEAFDAEAALAEIEAKIAANENQIAGADDELFDELPFDQPPRLASLAALWGEDRVRPGDSAAEAQTITQLALAADGALAVLGPGRFAPIAAIAGVHPGRIDVFEWREESIEALSYGVRKAKLEERVSVSRIDLEAHVFKASAYDGLMSADDFAYCSYPPHLAQQIMKTLKPGAAALIEAYVGLRCPELATAFASSFAEPQILAHGDILQFFVDAGLTLENDEDLTGEIMNYARRGFKELSGRLSGAELDVHAARELAWEAEAWRARLKLLGQRRLERRRFRVRKAVDQSENTNAPEA
jgi:hypothetical protein